MNSFYDISEIYNDSYFAVKICGYSRGLKKDA